MLENKRRTGTKKAKSSLPLAWLVLCLSSPSASLALQYGGFVPRERLDAKGLLPCKKAVDPKHAEPSQGYLFSLCGFANGYFYFEFISTARRYLHCAILRYFVKKFAKEIVKEDANTTTPNTKRANTVIFHQHKFQHISFICDYT